MSTSCRWQTAGSAGANRANGRSASSERRSNVRPSVAPSADLDARGIQERVRGHVEVFRCGPAADAAGGVVLRAMAGAEIAAEIALVIQRDATQMCADADEDQPFRFDGAILIGGLRTLWKVGIARELIRKAGDWNSTGFCNFFWGAAADEHRFAAPHHGDLLARLHWRQIKLDGGQRQYGGGRVHLVDEGPCQSGQSHAARRCRRDMYEVAAGRLGRCRGCHGYHPWIRRSGVESLGSARTPGNPARG